MLTKLGLLPERASTIAGRYDALFFFLAGVSLFFATLIATLIVVFAIRYRRRSPDQKGAAIHGSLLLETIWSGIPFAIAMFVFVWAASIYMSMARPPDDALEVFVVGKQWMWKLQHLEGRREINELHVPVGRPVKLTMTSEDVIHSFFVPAFRVKADVVPGRYTTVWFQPTKVGTYHLFCAEYCGTEHSRMTGRVIVQEPHEYEEWLKGGGAGGAGLPGAPEGLSMAALGGALFNKSGCPTCHLVDASSGNPADMVGPPLYAVYKREVELEGGRKVIADEEYLRRSILQPMAQIVRGYEPLMPTYEGRLSQIEVLQLVAYLKSLSEQPSAAGGAEQAPAQRPNTES
ncbi:MAG: cytochrome c oxidase subunit II [Candidatus Dadabacteria bacterium]|nr:MAG: cytochrome c oxidase subunit II [Candidatus Dadabacteria bacterium]